jgi:hypothetical protein
MSGLLIMGYTDPCDALPQAVDAIGIDNSRRVSYSAMPLHTRVYGGFMQVSYGSDEVHTKGAY